MLDAFINQYPPAVLVLADGSVFRGVAIGAEGASVGEVVFNTSMTGYQEILTDPSYCQQLVTMTCPHIGNVGVNPFDEESNQIHAAGLIIRDYSLVVSNWRSAKSLEVYLKQNGIVAIANVDTRRLTRLLRDKGAQNGCILAGSADETLALSQAQTFPGLLGKDLAKEVTTKKILEWTEGSFDITRGKFSSLKKPQFHVVAYDFGVKWQILRKLVDRGVRVTLVPATTSAQQVLALKPDGVMLSNGPGDPAACDYAIAAIKQLAATDTPLFGICLGFQLLALACEAKTIKMKFGHHGANHPVKDLQTNKVYITSQNHGFAVDKNQLPDTLEVTHESLFDGSLQGFKHKTKPIIAFQGHPEASPGPGDIDYLFDQFIKLLQARIHA